MNFFGKPKARSFRDPEEQNQYIETLHEKMESCNQSGHYKEGMKCCDEALEINPYDAVAWRYKGLLQRNMGEMKNGTFREGEVRGDREKALTYWSNALDDPWCLYHYGSTLWELNRIRESVPYLQKCLNKPPNQTIRSRVSELLYLYEDLVKKGRV